MCENATDVALQTLSRVMGLLQRGQSTLSAWEVIEKDDGSPVTVYDLAVQALVVNLLEQAGSVGEFPVCGEESAEILRDPGMEPQRARVIELAQSEMPDLESDSVLAAIDRGSARPEPLVRSSHWTLDPIDGTMNFVHR